MIAIENARLFRELKEALEQQTATSEILGVIASSPTDIQPVLDVVANNAARVCDATDAIIYRTDGSGSVGLWPLMEPCLLPKAVQQTFNPGSTSRQSYD